VTDSEEGCPLLGDAKERTSVKVRKAKRAERSMRTAMELGGGDIREWMGMTVEHVRCRARRDDIPAIDFGNSPSVDIAIRGGKRREFALAQFRGFTVPARSYLVGSTGRT
jgi:hypothetical protein